MEVLIIVIALGVFGWLLVSQNNNRRVDIWERRKTEGDDAPPTTGPGDDGEGTTTPISAHEFAADLVFDDEPLAPVKKRAAQKRKSAAPVSKRVATKKPTTKRTATPVRKKAARRTSK